MGAGGKGVALDEVVEEGGVLLPNFVGFVDGDEAILVVVDHSNDLVY